VKLSVAVTAYNQQAFIEETLRSVLAQTRPPDEIVVVDDGSSDETWDRIQRVLGTDPRARLVRQENAGVSEARNRAIRESTGDIVSLIDGDDLWEPVKLATVAAAFEQHPQAGLVADNVRLFTETLGLRRVVSEPDYFPAVPVEWVGRYVDTLLREGNTILSCSQASLARRALDAVGESDPRLPVASDYHLYIRVAARFEVVLLQQRLSWWRQRDGSASGAGDERVRNWQLDTVRALALLARDEPQAARYADAARQLARRYASATYRDRFRGRRLASRHIARLGMVARSPVLALHAVACLLPYRLSGSGRRPTAAVGSNAPR
jgi:glycosyltransferase involved in cell wall biosynthesis